MSTFLNSSLVRFAVIIEILSQTTSLSLSISHFFNFYFGFLGVVCLFRRPANRNTGNLERSIAVRGTKMQSLSQQCQLAVDKSFASSAVFVEIKTGLDAKLSSVMDMLAARKQLLQDSFENLTFFRDMDEVCTIFSIRTSRVSLNKVFRKRSLLPISWSLQRMLLIRIQPIFERKFRNSRYVC